MGAIGPLTQRHHTFHALTHAPNATCACKTPALWSAPPQVSGPVFLAFNSYYNPTVSGDDLTRVGFHVAFRGQMVGAPRTLLFLFLGIGCGCSVAFVWLAAVLSRWHPRRAAALRRAATEVSVRVCFKSVVWAQSERGKQRWWRRRRQRRLWWWPCWQW
jgi:hypothetical protein